MNKSDRQQIGIDKWRNNKGIGGFQYPTGFGKMYVMIQIIKRMIEKIENTRVIIVVNSDALRDEWRQKIEYFIGARGIIMVETIHYFQIKRFEHNTDLLILDESSQYFSNDRRKVWNGEWVRFKFLSWLDATPNDKLKRDAEFFEKFPCVDKITKEEAEQNKWVTKSQVINYAIELTEEEMEAYKKAENMIDENFNKFNRNLDTVYKCLQGGDIEHEGSIFPVSAFKYCTYIAEQHGWCEEYQGYMRNGFPLSWDKDSVQFVQDICATWTPEKVMAYAKKVSSGIRHRLDIVYMAKNKIQATLRLLEYYKDKQTIIFGQRTDFCTLVTKAINSRFGDIAIEYHSNIESRALKIDVHGNPTLIGGNEFAVYATGKNKGSPKIFGATVLRRLAIETIRQNRARVLVTGSALDRGLDVPRIELGIVTGFTQNENQNKQRQGRISRIDIENENKEAIFVNLYVPNTKEHQFLLKQQRQSNEAIWINDLKQLTETYIDYDV